MNKSNGPGYLASQLKAIVKTNQPYSQYATITDVDTTKFTCSLKLNLNETMVYDDVPLSAFGDKGFIPIPKIDSQVVVCFFDDNHCVVVQTSDISKYKISNDTLELKTMLLNLADAIINGQYLTSQGPTQPTGMINQADVIKFKQDVNGLFL